VDANGQDCQPQRVITALFVPLPNHQEPKRFLDCHCQFCSPPL